MDSPISAYMHGGKEVLKKTKLYKLYFSEVEWLLLWFILIFGKTNTIL